MPELRWTLLIIGVVFIVALAWWERRRPHQASRQSPHIGGESRPAAVEDSGWGDGPAVAPSRSFRDPGLSLPEMRATDARPRDLPVTRDLPDDVLPDDESGGFGSPASLGRELPVIEEDVAIGGDPALLRDLPVGRDGPVISEHGLSPPVREREPRFVVPEAELAPPSREREPTVSFQREPTPASVPPATPSREREPTFSFQRAPSPAPVPPATPAREREPTPASLRPPTPTPAPVAPPARQPVPTAPRVRESAPPGRVRPTPPPVVEIEDDSLIGLRVDGERGEDGVAGDSDLDEMELDEEEAIVPLDEVEEPAAAPVQEPVNTVRPLVEWPPETERKVISLRLVARPPDRFRGNLVRQALAAEGFVLGDFDIFHKPDAANRAVLSAASLTKPGSFELDTMDTQRFVGLNLFAVLPGPRSPQKAFEELLLTARMLNERLEGALQDEKGGPLTPTRIQALRDSLGAEAKS